jgi:hypothetical protein
LHKNKETLVLASKEMELEVNADKTKYLIVSRDQNARRIHNAKFDNSFFERLEQFKYLGKAITNNNCIQDEIKSRLKSWNVCYHSVQNRLSSSFYPEI